MDDSTLRYTVVPRQCLDSWLDSVGITKLHDEITVNLAEDVTYRVREVVHNAVMFMKHSKRSCLTTEDFNNALREMNTEPVYGHCGSDTVSYKAVPYRDGRLCYVEEKDRVLREVALDTNYPPHPGEPQLKASWVVIEGKECNSGKIKEEADEIDPKVESYLSNMTSALLGKNSQLRKVALDDLRCNQKLQPIMTHLISFLSSQVKLKSSKISFEPLCNSLLLAVNAIAVNKSILLAPYSLQLVKIILYMLMDAKLSDWSIRDRAALTLANVCRNQHASQPNLYSQLVTTFKERLNDKNRPFYCVSGAIVAVQVMGVKAIEEALVPVVGEILERLTSAEDTFKRITIEQNICDAAAILFANSSMTKERLELYNMLNEYCGEMFLACCVHNYCVNRTATNLNAFQASRPVGVVGSELTLTNNDDKNTIKVTFKASKNWGTVSQMKDGKISFKLKKRDRKWENIFDAPAEKKYLKRKLVPDNKGHHLSLKRSRTENFQFINLLNCL